VRFEVLNAKTMKVRVRGRGECCSGYEKSEEGCLLGE
jgi:hypothetical protein